jgi:predicted RNase H-like HicB family nuclease
MPQKLHLPVIIERDENGVFVAECPVLKGCYTQGETLEEAMENIREVIQMHIELMMERGEPLPSVVACEEVEVVVQTQPSKAS